MYYSMKFEVYVVILVLSVFFSLVFGDSITKEGMSDCPDQLTESNGSIFLANTKKDLVPEKNPLKFNSLDEYGNYVENGSCPALYLRNENFDDKHGTYIHEVEEVNMDNFCKDGKYSAMCHDYNSLTSSMNIIEPSASFKTISQSDDPNIEYYNIY